jgi:hypothetical protein
MNCILSRILHDKVDEFLGVKLALIVFEAQRIEDFKDKVSEECCLDIRVVEVSKVDIMSLLQNGGHYLT